MLGPPPDAWERALLQEENIVRIIPAFLLLAIGLVLACSTGPREREELKKVGEDLTKQPEFQSPPTTNKPRKHLIVQFNEGWVHPSVARLLPEGNLAWVNLADNLVAAVVFPKSIKESFTCTELRPLFFEVSAGYQSIQVTGEEGENVTLPCPLKPGSYDYQIYLSDEAGSDRYSAIDNPTVTLPAKIVVE